MSDDTAFLPTAQLLQLDTIIILACIPSFFMLCMTVVGLGIKVPSDVAGALQHFAAGVLLSAISTELLPTLVAAQGFHENLGLTIGFVLGMALLIVLGMILPEGEEEDDDDGDEPEASSLITRSMRKTSSKRKTSGLKTQGYAIEKNYLDKVTKEETEANDESPATEHHALLGGTSTSSTTSPKPFPAAFLVAVIVDSFIDGLLIGIAAAAGPSAGPMMAGSLSVEMSFVGLTLATALHGMPLRRSIPAAIVGPVTLIVGASCGGLLSGALQAQPALFAGMMGFGTSALLFMVAEELLLEAHEDGGHHIWWVDLQLYVGFYASFMSTKLFA